MGVGVNQLPEAVDVGLSDGFGWKWRRFLSPGQGLIPHPCGHRLREPGPQVLGQLGYGGRIEQGHRVDDHIQRGLKTVDNDGGAQRIAPQLEEVVVHAHRIHAQHLRPEFGQVRLQRIPRGREVTPQVGTMAVGRGQSLQIHLARGRQGERVQDEEVGGDHVIGQGLLQEGVEVGHGGRIALIGDVRRQAIVAIGPLEDPGQGFLDPRMGQQSGFDLPQFDAIAPHLHLMIHSTVKFQFAADVPSDEIAGAIETVSDAARLRIRLKSCCDQARSFIRPEKRIGRKFFSGEVGAVEIAPGYARAADEQLAHHPARRQFPGCIHHPGVDVAHRAANGRGQGVLQLFGDDLALGGDDGGLGWAVCVEQPHRIAHPPEPLPQQRGLDFFAAENHQAQRVGGFQTRLFHFDDELMEKRGGHIPHRDSQGCGSFDEGAGRADHAVGAQGQGGARDQSGVDFLGRGVETDGGELQHPVLGR